VLGDEAVQRYLAGREPRKWIVVPGRLVNVVV
jgi:leucyl-tRNA synthetase